MPLDMYDVVELSFYYYELELEVRHRNLTIKSIYWGFPSRYRIYRSGFSPAAFLLPGDCTNHESIEE